MCLSHWILWSFKIDSCVSSCKTVLAMLQSHPESLPGIRFLGVLPTRIRGVDRGTVNSPALQIRGWASAHSGIWLYLSLAMCPEQALLSQGGNFWAEIGTSSRDSLRNVLSLSTAALYQDQHSVKVDHHEQSFMPSNKPTTKSVSHEI